MEIKSFKQFLNELENKHTVDNNVKEDKKTIAEKGRMDGTEIAKKYYKLHKQIIDNLADR